MGNANYFQDPVFRAGLEQTAGGGPGRGDRPLPRRALQPVAHLGRPRAAARADLAADPGQGDPARRRCPRGGESRARRHRRLQPRRPPGRRRARLARRPAGRSPTAVGGELAVLFDSGVRTGSDVFKALALGADAVCLGRPYIWGLALDGQAGVETVLKMILAELDLTMALCGYTTPDQLGPEALAPSRPRRRERLPRAPRERLLRHPQPLGPRHRPRPRLARLRGPGDDERRLRPLARPAATRRRRSASRPCVAHVAEICAATELPVNADFQEGYADDAEGVATNVGRCVEAGVAGLSIEDATGAPTGSRSTSSRGGRAGPRRPRGDRLERRRRPAHRPCRVLPHRPPGAARGGDRSPRRLRRGGRRRPLRARPPRARADRGDRRGGGAEAGQRPDRGRRRAACPRPGRARRPPDQRRLGALAGRLGRLHASGGRRSRRAASARRRRTAGPEPERPLRGLRAASPRSSGTAAAPARPPGRRAREPSSASSRESSPSAASSFSLVCGR